MGLGITLSKIIHYFKENGVCFSKKLYKTLILQFPIQCCIKSILEEFIPHHRNSKKPTHPRLQGAPPNAQVEALTPTVVGLQAGSLGGEEV